MTEENSRPDRLSVVAERQFQPDSLVGSFFLSGASPGWQGCVVAEPAPGVYLVELFSWIGGDSSGQQLVPIADMAGWNFYDNASWMTAAYEHGVADRWKREREDQRP